MLTLVFIIVIFFFFGETKANTDIQGTRLPTPKDGCGYSKVALQRIVGGSNAKNGAWPWMALVIYVDDAGPNSQCGGSLITTRHVLTAAHCYRKDLAFVRLGEHDILTMDDGIHENVPIIHVEKHPAYTTKGGAKNDIAIVYLEYNVRITDRIRPICLPFEENVRTENFINQNPIVIGWGSTAHGAKSATVLQQVQVSVLDNSVCKREYKRIDRLASPNQFDNSVICAGHLAGGKDSCSGDSGGPLISPVQAGGKFPFYQIGVVSYGFECGRPNVPSVYTNVKHFIEWIQEKVKMKLENDTGVKQDSQ